MFSGLETTESLATKRGDPNTLLYPLLAAYSEPFIFKNPVGKINEQLALYEEEDKINRFVAAVEKWGLSDALMAFADGDRRLRDSIPAMGSVESFSTLDTISTEGILDAIKKILGIFKRDTAPKHHIYTYADIAEYKRIARNYDFAIKTFATDAKARRAMGVLDPTAKDKQPDSGLLTAKTIEDVILHLKQAIPLYAHVASLPIATSTEEFNNQVIAVRKIIEPFSSYFGVSIVDSGHFSIDYDGTWWEEGKTYFPAKAQKTLGEMGYTTPKVAERLSDLLSTCMICQPAAVHINTIFEKGQAAQALIEKNPQLSKAEVTEKIRPILRSTWFLIGVGYILAFDMLKTIITAMCRMISIVDSFYYLEKD